MAAAAPNLEETIAKAQKGRVNVTPAEGDRDGRSALFARAVRAGGTRLPPDHLARPGNADAHNILGVSLAALGKSDDASPNSSRAIKINSEAPSYHANLGEILRLAGDSMRPRRRSKPRSSWRRNNAQALNNLGIIQYEKRNFKKAVEYYRRALAINPLCRKR